MPISARYRHCINTLLQSSAYIYRCLSNFGPHTNHQWGLPCVKMKPCDRHEENAGIVVHELSLRNSEDFEGSNKICKLRLVMSQNPMQLTFLFAERGWMWPYNFYALVDVCLSAFFIGMIQLFCTTRLHWILEVSVFLFIFWPKASLWPAVRPMSVVSTKLGVHAATLFTATAKRMRLCRKQMAMILAGRKGSVGKRGTTRSAVKPRPNTNHKM